MTLVSRDHPPLSGGYDATGVPRRIVKAQSNGIALEPIIPGQERPSWLFWPKASEVAFTPEAPGVAQLFTVRGMTYRICLEPAEEVCASALHLSIKVENAYSDGHGSEQIHDVVLERFRGEDDLWEQLFTYTGDGHGRGADLGSLYMITVLGCPERPELVGLSNEWVD
ncbi:hypothetical protein FIV07_27645 (plasmid) [Mycobacterium sp. THAF192]|nr:hypothetical protein FIV07_27645 [Mycobacterium sp. THAF192]